MAFKLRPGFELGYEAMVPKGYDAHGLTRPRLKRLFKMTVFDCEIAFAQLPAGGQPNVEELADQIAGKFQSGILVTIAVGILVQLLVAWIKKLWEDYRQ
jgi:hypothetical protein